MLKDALQYIVAKGRNSDSTEQTNVVTSALLFSIKYSDTEIFVSESSNRVTCPVPVPKDRMSTRRTDPIQDTRIDRSIHDLALDAVQVFEVEEITSCTARSAAPEGC